MKCTGCGKESGASIEGWKQVIGEGEEGFVNYCPNCWAQVQPYYAQKEGDILDHPPEIERPLQPIQTIKPKQRGEARVLGVRPKQTPATETLTIIEEIIVSNYRPDIKLRLIRGLLA